MVNYWPLTPIGTHTHTQRVDLCLSALSVGADTDKSRVEEGCTLGFWVNSTAWNTQWIFSSFLLDRLTVAIRLMSTLETLGAPEGKRKKETAVAELKEFYKGKLEQIDYCLFSLFSRDETAR